MKKLKTKASKVFHCETTHIEIGYECITQIGEKKHNEYKIIILYIYLMCCLKWLKLNLDIALSVKLVWINHQYKYQKSKYINEFPYLYIIDEETLQGLMKMKF